MTEVLEKLFRLVLVLNIRHGKALFSGARAATFLQ